MDITINILIDGTQIASFTFQLPEAKAEAKAEVAAEELIDVRRKARVNRMQARIAHDPMPDVRRNHRPRRPTGVDKFIRRRAIVEEESQLDAWVEAQEEISSWCKFLSLTK